MKDNNKKLNVFTVGNDLITLLDCKYKFYEIDKDQYKKLTTEAGVGINQIIDKPGDSIVYFKNSDNLIFYVIKYSLLFITISRLPEFYKYRLSKRIEKLSTSPYVILRFQPEVAKTNLQNIMDLKYDKICNPRQAQLELIDLLRKKLSEKEIKERIKQYQIKDNPSPSHYNFLDNDIEHNKIYFIENVHYYDVNKAYASRLAKAFPEIRKDIEKIIAKGKADPHYKKYSKDLFNFAIGCLREKDNKQRLYYKAFPSITPKQFNDFRSWIVKDIDNQVNLLMRELDGYVFYINTDGIIIKDPKIIPEDDQSLGGFKKEIIDNNKIWYYSYEDENDEWNKYSIMQWFENGTKIIKVIGGYLQDERLLELTDLSKGKTVKFKTEIKNGRKQLTEYKEN